MLIKIDKRGIALLELKERRDVHGTPRYYYVGAADEITALIVTKGTDLSEGQIWEASSGNELGYPPICRKAHTRKKIGKLTLQRLVEPDLVEEDAQVYPLSYQIRYFVEHFGNLIEFNRRWSK